MDQPQPPMGTRLWGRLRWSVELLYLAGYTALRPTPVPMRMVRYAHHGTQRPGCLIVFLPGRWNWASQYETAQFVQAVHHAGIRADMEAVEAHNGYNAKRTVLTRLREDVIAPALAQGYTQIWLVGVSMGGLGALLYVRAYPEDITGVVALAPFLGDPDVITEIRAAGGVHHWQPTTMAPGDYQRHLWQWLQRYLARPEGGTALYLGYGHQDRFAPAHQLLATGLPGAQVFTTRGGHDWQTWRLLWQAFLRQAALPSGRP
jgi:pimeloyl-ACP methyl ester carboxylesterase